MVLSDDMQTLVGVMLEMANVVTNLMNKMLPAIHQLQSYLLSTKDLNLEANNEFNQVCNLYYCTVLIQERVCVEDCKCVSAQ